MLIVNNGFVKFNSYTKNQNKLMHHYNLKWLFTANWWCYTLKNVKLNKHDMHLKIIMKF
jgi:hypothetical protein